MHNQPAPPQNTKPGRVKAFLLAHPKPTALIVLVLIAGYITWPIHTDRGAPIAWFVSTASFLLLLFTLERTFSSTWPYHYFWGAACCALAIVLPILGSLYFERPAIDVAINTLLAGGPIFGVVCYKVLRG